MTTQETALADGVLGRHVDYPQGYDAALLFPIARALNRHALGIHDDALPFIGHDRWHAYELSWLDAQGKPRVATATFEVPAHSPNLVESKSLKLYLNSFNASRFASDEAVRARIAEDLSRVAGAPVQVAFGLPGIDALDEDMLGGAMLVDRAHDADLGDRGAAPRRKPKPVGGSVCIDALDIAIDHYGPPRAEFISAGGDIVEETLTSALLKSNCPVTGQPDWARLIVTYRGPRLDRAGLLRYLVSFRDHAEFHEQCVERIYTDLLAHARPQRLSVEARYTRRGGLDINPWRAMPGCAAPVAGRDERQ